MRDTARCALKRVDNKIEADPALGDQSDPTFKGFVVIATSMKHSSAAFRD
jgi:hypothetical protein